MLESSAEGLSVARPVQADLSAAHDCEVWSQGVFRLGEGTLESLTRIVRDFDFAVFVFSADDLSNIRDEWCLVARDNVVFEMGLFTGVLGRDRVYFVLPSRAQGPKPRVPSDLAGITHGWYDGRLAAERPLAAVGPFCDEVRRCITARCDSDSVVRGRLEARRLRAIGPDVPPEVEGDVAYAFEGVEFVVTGQRVRLRASARLSGKVNADTQIEGWGEHHDGIVYAIYSMHSPEDNLTIGGVAHLRLPKDGHEGGRLSL